MTDHQLATLIVKNINSFAKNEKQNENTITKENGLTVDEFIGTFAVGDKEGYGENEISCLLRYDEKFFG